MSKKVLIIWHGGLYPSYRKPFWILQKEYGWNVHLLAASSWKKALPRSTRFQQIENEPINLHIHYPLFKFHGATHVQLLLPWIYNNINPDILFVIEEPFSLMGWFSTYWSRRAVPNVPIILFSYQDIYKRYPPPFGWFEQYILRQANRILVSNTTVGKVLERKKYNKMWDVLPSAVNLDKFTYKEPRSNGEFFTLGYVGRLADEKGIDTLLWALEELNDSVRLRVAGEGPASHRLAVLAKELGVQEQVAFLKTIPHEDLPDFYHECDAIVLPSKTTKQWQEQFGRVLVEAMACGVPVIGSDCGAIPEVVDDAGLIFPENKSPKLAECIELLQQDERLRRDFSFQGRIRAEQLYSAERVAKKLDHHLSDVLSRIETNSG